ncbi:hypothetical protein V5O48_012034 [Marasmius crinis-equi]|uniref:Uncharacterized protein n=1 Tax=Marasmius crinis-equi TaxID=585013 RepID=A0ABR3F4I9_9AGAR
MASKLLADPFQRRITDHFEIYEVKRFPKSAPKAPKMTHFVFYFANGRHEVFEFEDLPPRTRLSDYQRFLARFQISPRPQLRILVIEGSSCCWKYIGWSEYFDIPLDDTPVFFHLSNNFRSLQLAGT